MNDDVNANLVIAEGLTARGFPEALAWEADELMCENGHFTVKSTWHVSVGDLCPKGLGDCEKLLRLIPHDFTNPTYLLPVINALGDQPDVIDIALDFHRVHSARFWEGTLKLYVSTPSGREATTQEYEGRGSEWEDAVADALHAVVIGEEVGRDS